MDFVMTEHKRVDGSDIRRGQSATIWTIQDDSARVPAPVRAGTGLLG